MVRLYRVFRRVPFMANAIAIRAEGDATIVELQRLAAEAHAAGAGLVDAQRADYMQGSRALDVESTRLERRISARPGSSPAPADVRTDSAAASSGS